MRISYEWLGDFVDLTDVSPKEAAAMLTRLGIEIESLTLIDLSQILIGKILEQIPHPKSNKPLWVHQVDLGRGQPGQHQPGVAGQPLARRRQPYGALRPVDECDVELALERGQLLRDSRRGEGQRTCGGRNPAVLRHGEQDLEPADVQHVSHATRRR